LSADELSAARAALRVHRRLEKNVFSATVADPVGERHEYA
jgi:hypothetical protein